MGNYGTVQMVSNQNTFMRVFYEREIKEVINLKIIKSTGISGYERVDKGHISS